MITEYVAATALPSVEHTSWSPDAMQLRSLPLVVGVMVRIPPLSVVIVTGAPLAVAVKVNETEPKLVLSTVPLVGLTAMAEIPPRNTVAVADAVTAWALAEMVAVPSETPMSAPPAVMLATLGVSLDHETPLDTRPVLPSLKVP